MGWLSSFQWDSIGHLFLNCLKGRDLGWRVRCIRSSNIAKRCPLRINIRRRLSSPLSDRSGGSNGSKRMNQLLRLLRPIRSRYRCLDQLTIHALGNPHSGDGYSHSARGRSLPEDALGKLLQQRNRQPERAALIDSAASHSVRSDP